MYKTSLKLKIKCLLSRGSELLLNHAHLLVDVGALLHLRAQQVAHAPHFHAKVHLCLREREGGRGRKRGREEEREGGMVGWWQ